MGGFASAGSLMAEAVRSAARPETADVGTFILAAIFVATGAMKLRKPQQAALAIFSFGATKRPVQAAGVALGLVEVGLGVGLLLGVAPILWLGAASALLWLFAYAIARQLAAGSTFPCFCFGDTSDVISRWTFVRAASLAAIATSLALAAPEVRTSDVRVLGVEAVVATAVLSCALLFGQLPWLVQLGHHQHGAAAR